MKTLAVLSRKGGAGKTTVSLSIALAARQAGLKVVVADVDPLHSAGEVMRTRPEATSMLFETTASKLFILQDACRQNGCDLLVIDTPAAPDAEALRAANVADLCLAVARPTALDVAAVRDSIALIRRADRPGMVVLNQCPPMRGGAEPDVVVQALERLRFGHLPIAAAKLRSRMAYQRAFAHNCAVTEWDPGSEAAAEVLRLLAEISNRMVLVAASSASAMEARSGSSPVHRMREALRRLA